MRLIRPVVVLSFFLFLLGTSLPQSPFIQLGNLLPPIQAINSMYPGGKDVTTFHTSAIPGGGEELVWRILRPNVSERDTVYNAISFVAGDTIRINAGGCVQTGGHGNTWKRYVDPSGPDSDRYYHGLIWIPGVTEGGPQKIAGVLGQTFTVPPNLPPSATKLHLGYEDESEDGYEDNGYYAHDNGTDNQCKNVGDAFVEVNIRRGVPQSTPFSEYSPHRGPFDVVWKQVDENLLPYNPIWAKQIDNPGVRYRIGDGCAGIPLLSFQPPCTYQAPSFDQSEQIFGFLGECNGDVLDGHANWTIATYDGVIKWQDHSTSTPFGDDDYNFGLFRADHAGLTNLGDGLGLEFQARETIDRFTTSWWTRFHSAVDAGSADAHTMVDNKYAIATGVFGIDGVHGGWSELHPIYSLAIRDSSTNSPGGVVEERWVFFLRNWGNEGMCSHDQHYFPSAYGDGTYFIQIPWRQGSQRVDIESDKTIIEASFESSQLEFSRTPGEWLYLRAKLPDGDAEPLIHGEIVLQWTPAIGGVIESLSQVPGNTYPAVAHSAESVSLRGLDRIVDLSQRRSVSAILSQGAQMSEGGNVETYNRVIAVDLNIGVCE